MAKRPGTVIGPYKLSGPITTRRSPKSAQALAFPSQTIGGPSRAVNGSVCPSGKEAAKSDWLGQDSS